MIIAHTSADAILVCSSLVLVFTVFQIAFHQCNVKVLPVAHLWLTMLVVSAIQPLSAAHIVDA